MTVPGPNVLYQEKHEGMGFYDGTHVWIDPAGRGAGLAYHSVRHSQIGFDVSLEACSEQFRFTDADTPYEFSRTTRRFRAIALVDHCHSQQLQHPRERPRQTATCLLVLTTTSAGGGAK